MTSGPGTLSTPSPLTPREALLFLLPAACPGDRQGAQCLRTARDGSAAFTRGTLPTLMPGERGAWIEGRSGADCTGVAGTATGGTGVERDACVSLDGGVPGAVVAN